MQPVYYDIDPQTAKTGLSPPTRLSFSLFNFFFTFHVSFPGNKLRLEDPLLSQLLITEIKFVGGTVILFKHCKRSPVAISIIKVIFFLWLP